MTWHLATENPRRCARYPVLLTSGTLIAAFWSPERGWTDGLTKLNHVRGWFDLPPFDATPQQGET